MTTKLAVTIAAAAGLAAAACSHSGLPERNALIGGALGAGAGAIIGNNTGSGDAATGAAIGAAVGAAAGLYTGCRAQGGCFVGGRQVSNEPIYDRATGRYYYVDPQSGRTYWADGSPRTY